MDQNLLPDIKINFSSNLDERYLRRILLCVVISLILHVLFLLLMTAEFSKEIVYEELSLDLPTATPVVMARAPQVVNQVKLRDDVLEINDAIELIKEEKKEEKIVEKKEAIEQQNVQESNITVESDFQEEIDFEPFYAVDKRPSFARQAVLTYPFKEKQQGKEAVVIIEVDIDDRGILRNYRIVKSGGDAFDAAVIEMIKSSLYVPGYKGGRPVPVRMRFPIRFQLS